MKKTGNLVIATFSLLIFGLWACTESTEYSRACESDVEIGCKTDTNLVNVRVANWTGYPICDLNIKYAIDVDIDYGSLDPFDTTCYVAMVKAQTFPEVMYTIGEGVYVTHDTLLVPPYSVANIGTPGKYILTLTIDSLTAEISKTSYLPEP